MFDTKFIVTLLSLVISIIAICNFNGKKNDNVIENFWGNGARGQKNEVIAYDPTTGQMTDLPATQTLIASRNLARNSSEGFSHQGNNQGNNQRSNQGSNQGSNKCNNKDQFMTRQTDLPFYQTPAFESYLSPRTYGGDYGSNITYNLPARENLAVPENPLTFGNMAKENYSKENFSCSTSCGNKSPPTCGFGSSIPPYNVSEPTLLSSSESLSSGQGPSLISALPVSLPMGTMESTSGSPLGSGGDHVEPVILTRTVFAQKKSRTQGQGDPIRGDLAIVPHSTGWFQSSINNPLQDLQQGALFAMAGQNMQNSKDMAALINLGTINTPIAGVNLSNSELTSMGATALGGDLITTAFP